MTTIPSPGTPSPQPGYYPDPTTGVSRWWDGQQWGGFAQPTVAQPVAANRAAQNTGVTGYGIAALVLGLCWLYGVGSILAIIFGVKGRRDCDEQGKGGRGMATAGLILGIVGLAALLLVIVVAASGAAAYDDSYATVAAFTF